MEQKYLKQKAIMEPRFTFVAVPNLTYHGYETYYQKPLKTHFKNPFAENMVFATEFNDHSQYFLKTADTMEPLGKYIGQKRVASPYRSFDGDFIYYQFELKEISETQRSSLFCVSDPAKNMIHIDGIKYESYDVYYLAN